MQLHDFTILADTLFPKQTALAGDPVGLQILSQKQTANHLLFAFEVTDDVIDEAEVFGADVLVVFHPLIYRPLDTLATERRVPHLVRRMVRADIALFVIHTNFDAHPRGTSQLFANSIGLSVERRLSNSVIDGYGMGTVSRLDQPLAMDELLQRIVHSSSYPLRFCSPPSSDITTVAIVGGSGASFIEDAIQQHIDVLITADIKYHDYHAAKGLLGLIDAGHYEMERFVPQGIANVIGPYLKDSVLSVSAVSTNPVQYFSPLQQEFSTPLTGIV